MTDELRSCHECATPISKGARFCSACGARALGSSISESISKVLTTQVKRAIDERLVEETALVSLLTDKVEELFWKRQNLLIKLLSAFFFVVVTVVGGGLTLFGLNTLNGIKEQTKPVADAAMLQARAAAEKAAAANGVATSALSKAQTTQANVEELLSSIQATKAAVDGAETQVTTQLASINKQVGGISARISQEVATLNSTLQSVSSQQAKNRIEQLIPGIGQQRHFFIDSPNFASTGKNIVHIYINPALAPKLNEAEILQLESSLKDAGFTPTLGYVGYTPPTSIASFLVPASSGSWLYYFRRDDKAAADKIYAVTSKIFGITSLPIFSDPNADPINEMEKGVVDQTGIVAEIVILAIAPKP